MKKSFFVLALLSVVLFTHANIQAIHFKFEEQQCLQHLPYAQRLRIMLLYAIEKFGESTDKQAIIKYIQSRFSKEDVLDFRRTLTNFHNPSTRCPAILKRKKITLSTILKQVKPRYIIHTSEKHEDLFAKAEKILRKQAG